MEIEITPTKKKLTASIVKQMPIANQSDIHFAMMYPTDRVLGFITDYKYNKMAIKAAIIKGFSDWCIFPLYDTTVAKKMNRIYSDNPTEYARDVEVYYTDQKVGSIHRQSKNSEDKAEIEAKAKEANDLVKFARGLHIYL